MTKSPTHPHNPTHDVRPRKPYRYLFGPLPSRRFGRSLGIDLVPFKTCPLNCRFCQLGPTSRVRLARRAYVPTEAVLAELDDWLRTDGNADVITLAGSGEPTLHSGFGRILAHLRKGCRIPTLLLSNGALFADPRVRQAALAASYVKLSLHAADPETFARIVRPHVGIGFAAMIAGYRAFRDAFEGALLLEVFVVPGINDAPAVMDRIAALAATIRPDRVDLNTAVRPSADGTVAQVDAATLRRLAYCFSPPAMLPGEASPAVRSMPARDADGHAPSDMQLLDLLRRHPSDVASLARFFELPADALHSRLQALQAAGRLRHDARSDCWSSVEPGGAPA